MQINALNLQLSYQELLYVEVLRVNPTSTFSSQQWTLSKTKKEPFNFGLKDASKSLYSSAACHRTTSLQTHQLVNFLQRERKEKKQQRFEDPYNSSLQHPYSWPV